MQIVINITAEGIKTFFTGLGLATFIFLIAYPIIKLLRRFNFFKSKADILIKQKEDNK